MKENEIKRKPGRPVGSHVDWSTVGLLYKHHSNREIAQKLKCSIVAVFLRRKAAIKAGNQNAVFVGNKKTGTKPRASKAVAVETPVAPVEVPAEVPVQE